MFDVTPFTVFWMFSTLAFFCAVMFNYLSSYPVHYVDEGISQKDFDASRKRDIVITFIGMLVSAFMVAFLSQ